MSENRPHNLTPVVNLPVQMHQAGPLTSDQLFVGLWCECAGYLSVDSCWPYMFVMCMLSASPTFENQLVILTYKFNLESMSTYLPQTLVWKFKITP